MLSRLQVLFSNDFNRAHEIKEYINLTMTTYNVVNENIFNILCPENIKYSHIHD